MLLADALPNAASRVKITATDISRAMVERTRAGRFSQLEVNRGLPAPMLIRHFTRVGTEWEIAPALRQMVTASELNLAGAMPRLGPFDVVYLRNVLIYFDPPTKRDILRKVRQVMRPDGWLFLGAAETTLGVDDTWERVPCGRGSAYRPTKGN
jgi:chemotaxis protein methyltransferase CheR